MTDQNLEVRKVCDRGLVLIAESDAKWQERIKNERFCWHNAQWLEAIAKANFLSSPGDKDNISPTFLRSNGGFSIFKRWTRIKVCREVYWVFAYVMPISLTGQAIQRPASDRLNLVLAHLSILSTLGSRKVVILKMKPFVIIHKPISV